ncbi:MAG: D-alanyl-D-alanine carboxypeptidase/D-alanyl-D-alanine-endopeptidase [Bacteroidia bacterium]
MQQRIDSVARMAGMENAGWGVVIMETATGKILAQHEANRSLVTASVMKVITTATALSILGKDYQFSTFLEYSGEIKNGILNGNLYLRGGGDPTLGSYRLGEELQTEGFLVMLGNVLKKMGVKKITGDIIGDGSLFDNRNIPDTWTWGDMGNYYGTGVSGLNINENMYSMVLKSGRNVGEPVDILFTEPNLHKSFQLVNELSTGESGTGDNAFIYSSPFSDRLMIRGTIPKNQNNFHVRGSIPNPELFAAQLLCEKFADMEIDVVGEAKSYDAEKNRQILHNQPKTLIYTHLSPPLSKIVEFTNTESVNLFAEALMKMIGLKQKGKGTLGAGLAATLEFWKSKGLDTRGMFLQDGSGLSPNNTATAKQIAFVLQTMAKDTVLQKVFEESLAIAGKTGTISDMGEETAAEGNVRAKSGYISKVHTYSGYVTTKSKRQWTFVFLANYYNDSPNDMKKRVEKLFIEMAEAQD